MNIEFRDLLDYLKILQDGLNKPDLSRSDRSTTGTVRETKNLMPYIEAVNDKICDSIGITEEVEVIKERIAEEEKIKRTEIN